jgi:hypothetical protein
MTDAAILARHGFTAAQAARAIAKPVAKRTDHEQALIVALLGASL